MTIEQRLAEAEAALHELLTGKSVASITDQNGESVTYTHANRGALSAYVESLRRQLTQPAAVKTTRFETTKG